MARRSRHGFSTQSHSQKTILIVLTIIALLLLTSGQIYKNLYNGLQNASLAITSPLIGFVTQPFIFFSNLHESIRNFNSINTELQALKLELRQSSYWESYAKAAIAENNLLRKRWHLPDDFPELPGSFVVARIIADLSGTFIDSLLINSGEKNSITINDIALDNGVLVGRVIHTNKHYSRILLLTDINSRIPVIIGPDQARAIMGGNNSSFPDILFPTIATLITQGMEVKTSGHGGVFPPGIPIGTIIFSDDNAIKVNPTSYSNQLKYLDILSFHARITPKDTVHEITDIYENAAQ